MIPSCRPIKITMQNVALTMPHAKKHSPSISVKRHIPRQVQSRTRSIIETFDFTIIPNYHGHRSSEPQSQIDYRRSKKASSYLVYKQKQREVNRQRNIALSNSLVRRYREQSPQNQPEQLLPEQNNQKIKPPNDKKRVSMVYLGSEKRQPYHPNDKSRRLFIKTSQGKRQTIDTVSYIKTLKAKNSMNKTMQLKRPNQFELNPKNEQSSVEMTRAKQGWLHRRSQTAAVNMMYRGRVSKKPQRSQREQVALKSSGGQMCRPWTPRHGRDEIENAEQF